MKCLTTLSFLLILFTSMAQDLETRSRYRHSIFRTSSKIIIDGNPNDPTWEQTEKVSDFRNHWPLDTGQASTRTDVKITYDTDFIYILAICYDNGSRVIQSLRRDDTDSHWGSDNFTLVLDPMNTKQNGFLFGVNAGGSQMEAQLNVNGARTRHDANWDNKWYSEVKSYENYWVAEYAIPFKTLRYSSNIDQWGINFIRGDMEKNEYSTWTEFSLAYGGIDINFMGSLVWDEKPKQASGRVVLIPYLAGGTQRDFEEEGQNNYQENGDTGLDAKIAVTGSLNLDLTVNPDFSNVDVDQQVTNLSRFSVFFPERRNFFLENGDIFANFGSWQITPFFSRRIGLIDGEQVPINYGARLTGNLTKKTRIGVMNVQTRPFEDLSIQNYAVTAVHQQVLNRSVIKGIFMNRQSETPTADQTDYARNGGLEFAYLSKGGKFNNTVRYHLSNVGENHDNNAYYGFSGNYNGRSLRSGWTLDVVGENYITELGFNPRLENYNAETEETERKGYTRINPWTVYRFFPTEGRLNAHGPRTWHMVWVNQDGSGLNERNHGFAYDFMFRNTSEIRIQARVREVNLPVPTSLIGSDHEPLPIGNYQFNSYWINYSTDNRKIVNANIRVESGDFFNGARFNTSATLNFRIQPWGSFSLTHDYNRVSLPGEYGQANLNLIRANSQISFTNSMFLTTAVQFNSQSENYNFFTRFQWRYRPMSDLFLVYTDNYNMHGLELKNRQVVFKVTYWLNL